jgi:CRISPR/Cas system-associated exonuclease Cas4 (RecB family)
MIKSVDTLLTDINSLFLKKEGHDVNEENLELFAKNVKEHLRRALKEAGKRQGEVRKEIRMSKLGTPNRKLWFEHNIPNEEVNRSLDPSTLIKFIYGNFLEELALFLAKEAGHLVEGEQGEVEIEGVKGHRDCLIDGINVDIKSASKFSFQKFVTNSIHKNDPFGYIAQLSAYVHADGGDTGAFFVINKETGEMTLLKVHQIDMIDPKERIKEVKKVLSQSEPPVQKCYEPEPEGKSGNMALNKNCGFCEFKEICWKDAGLRKFKYSDGIKYLTKVVSVPKVEELV